MRYFIIFVTFFTLTPSVLANIAPKVLALSNQCVKDVKDFSHSQNEVLLYAFKYGKEHNLGLTLAAIAWQESCAGAYKMNFSDPSAGLYHAYIPGVLRRYNLLSDNSFNRNVVGEILIRDDEFSSKVALDELLYWNKVRDGDWARVIKSYNKGFSWEKDAKAAKSAKTYLQSIEEKVLALKSHLPKIEKIIKPKKRHSMLEGFKDTQEKHEIVREIKKQVMQVDTIKDPHLSAHKDIHKETKGGNKSSKAALSIYSKAGDDEPIYEKTLLFKPRVPIK